MKAKEVVMLLAVVFLMCWLVWTLAVPLPSYGHETHMSGAAGAITLRVEAEGMERGAESAAVSLYELNFRTHNGATIVSHAFAPGAADFHAEYARSAGSMIGMARMEERGGTGFCSDTDCLRSAWGSGFDASRVDVTTATGSGSYVVTVPYADGRGWIGNAARSMGHRAESEGWAESATFWRGEYEGARDLRVEHFMPGFPGAGEGLMGGMPSLCPGDWADNVQWPALP